jgi:hypothetical protein
MTNYRGNITPTPSVTRLMTRPNGMSLNYNDITYNINEYKIILVFLSTVISQIMNN